QEPEGDEGDQPGQRFAPHVPAPAPAPDARAVPSPIREPDGSWSSPLTPKPARRQLGPTRARYGRAGGPGFQPTPSDQPGPRGAGAEGPGLSPWQRSHQIWTEAGIEWERRPAPQMPWRPTSSRSAARPAGARQVSPARSPAPPEYAPQPEQTPWPGSYAQPGWAARTPVPLGAPVYSEPSVDEDDGPVREDRWGDEGPPIRQRPPGLLPEDEPDEAPDSDTLLFDYRRLSSRRPSSRRASSRRSGPGRLSRCTVRIAVA